MAIWSGGGFHLGKNNNESSSYSGDGMYLSSGAQQGPYYLTVRTPTISTPSTGSATTSDILDVITTGHWSGALWGDAWVVYTYYGAGVRYYKWYKDRGITSLNITQIDTWGAELGTESSLSAVNGTTIGSGTHGGQSVHRQTMRLTCTENYMHCHAVIRVGITYAQHLTIFDNASTQANVASNRASSGSGLHFRTVSLSGHPARDTA